MKMRQSQEICLEGCKASAVFFSFLDTTFTDGNKSSDASHNTLPHPDICTKKGFQQTGSPGALNCLSAPQLSSRLIFTCLRLCQIQESVNKSPQGFTANSSAILVRLDFGLICWKWMLLLSLQFYWSNTGIFLILNGKSFRLDRCRETIIRSITDFWLSFFKCVRSHKAVAENLGGSNILRSFVGDPIDAIPAWGNWVRLVHQNTTEDFTL